MARLGIRGVVIGVLFLLVMTTGNGYANSTGDSMNDWQVNLGKLKPDVDEEVFTQEFREVKSSIYGPLNAVTTLLKNSEKEELGRRFVVNLQTASVLLPKLPEDVNPNTKIWLLEQQIESLLLVRNQLIAQLVAELKNTSRLQVHEMFAERKYVNIRACDRAWVMLNQLHRADEDEVTLMVERDQFLHMPNNEKDKMIRELLEKFSKN